MTILLALATGCACGDETTQPSPSGELASAALEDDVARPELDGLEGFWSLAQAQAILERTEHFDIRADTSSLTEGEREAVERLMEVGEIFQSLYERSRHPQALAVRSHLETLDVAAGERERLTALRTLYELFQGPIAQTLEGEREPFAPVLPYSPGRNVYPSGVTAEELRAWEAAHVGSQISDVRTVVRRRTLEELTLDRGRRRDHPIIEVLHPDLRPMLREGPKADAFYAVPYSLAYAHDLVRAYGLLREAAELVRGDDLDLADYLEQRARDLLSNDYEAGDAAWVSGRFARLNAQIGAYETYDDHLLGQKAFFGLSILIRSPAESEELARAVARLSEFDSALPGGPYERVRSEIPVGIYDVLVDYGQARGGNTASILPNEAHITQKYGRTILIRRNVLRNPEIRASAERRWRAVVVEAHADDLLESGNFDRTVWHEVGHYLGPRRTSDGRLVSDALGNLQNHFEELKADLVSLWLLPRLNAAGILDPDRTRAAYAAGILRVLLSSEPPRTDVYGTMQLMQQNFFLSNDVLRFSDGTLSIEYARYPRVVEEMLREVLAIQRAGDRAAAEQFVERWARWAPDVQGAIGAALEAVAPRYRLARYAALE